ncbi:DUF3513 domain containing protein [Trichuris trichiura]|uniref:DUF3513 domain containing protein n=1 Tax=Trichuris trichiura TaxID=36087 RepID=A0A077ZAG8_TRITR|nr:DUF3513 domain containing protein [Trichuris trichiura]
MSSEMPKPFQTLGSNYQAGNAYDVPAQFRADYRPNIRNVPIKIEAFSKSPTAIGGPSKVSKSSIQFGYNRSPSSVSEEEVSCYESPSLPKTFRSSIGNIQPAEFPDMNSGIVKEKSGTFRGINGQVSHGTFLAASSFPHAFSNIDVRRPSENDASLESCLPKSAVFGEPIESSVVVNLLERSGSEAQNDLYDVPSSSRTTADSNSYDTPSNSGPLRGGGALLRAGIAFYPVTPQTNHPNFNRRVTPTASANSRDLDNIRHNSPIEDGSISPVDYSNLHADTLDLYKQFKSCVNGLVAEHLPNCAKSPSEWSVHFLVVKCSKALEVLHQLVNAVKRAVQSISLQERRELPTNEAELVKCYYPLFPALESSLKLMQEVFKSCDQKSQSISDRCSSLSQFVGIARQVLEQLRFMLALNSTSEFSCQPKKLSLGSSQPAGRTNEASNTSDALSMFDDYDFVENVLPSKANERSNDMLSPSSISKAALDIDIAQLCANLDEDSLEILRFYSPQINNHIQCLSNFVDEFLSAIENNQPPRIFIGQIKFVVLAAHKLVYIGDSIALCVGSPDLRWATSERANKLCENLRSCVRLAKMAAQNFPAIADVQAMIRGVVTVSTSAQLLRLLVDGCLGFTE